MKKGDLVLVQGRQEHKQYKDQQGNQKTYSYVNVQSVEFLSAKQEGQPQAQVTPKEPQTAQSKTVADETAANDLPF